MSFGSNPERGASEVNTIKSQYPSSVMVAREPPKLESQGSSPWTGAKEKQRFESVLILVRLIASDLTNADCVRISRSHGVGVARSWNVGVA